MRSRSAKLLKFSYWSAVTLMIGVPLVPLLFLVALNPLANWLGAYANTQYAEDFDARTFRSIEAGDSTSDLLSRLGPPIVVWPAEHDHTGRPQDWGEVADAKYERWEYAWYDEHSSFFIRGFLIDLEQNAVVARICMTYWD